MRKRIGESLIRAGLISEQDLQVALAEHKARGERLGAVLVRLDLVSERQVARALAHQLGLAYTNFLDHSPDPAVVALLPRDVAVKRLSIPVRFDDELLIVAMADPLHFGLLQELESRTSRRITPLVATRPDILRAIHAAYAAGGRTRYGSHEPIGATCAKCRRLLQTGWRFCPFCAARIATRLAKSEPLPGVAAM